MTLYLKYFIMNIKGHMQYRSALLLTTFGQFLVPLLNFLGIALLFERFENIAGWTFSEIALCFGVTMSGFSLAELFSRGFIMFANVVKSGDFDRVMLRPRSTALQVLGSDMDVSRIGLFAQGFMVLMIALGRIELPPFGGLIVVLMVLSCMVVFSGLFILGATMCFLTVEGLEAVNLFTYGGREMASYPVTIYAKWAARLFTFVIPFGCFNYLPLMYLVGRTDGNPLMYALSPLLGMLFIVPCLFVWNLGVRKYLSTGS